MGSSNFIQKSIEYLKLVGGCPVLDSTGSIISYVFNSIVNVGITSYLCFNEINRIDGFSFSNVSSVIVSAIFSFQALFAPISNAVLYKQLLNIIKGVHSKVHVE